MAVAGVVALCRAADFRVLTRRRAAPAATQTARTLFAVGRAAVVRARALKP